MNTSLLYIGNKLSIHGYTPTGIETLGPLLESEGCSVFYASDKKNPVFRLFDMLGAIFRKRKVVDAVLVDTYSTSAFYFSWASAVLCRLLGITYIPILHGGNLPDRINRSPGLSRQIFSFSFTNIVVSSYLQRCLVEKHYKHFMIPNSISIGDYSCKLRTTVRPRLLWVRAFDEIYNPQLAIRLLASLAELYDDALLTMVGPDKDGTMQVCKDMAKQLGVAERVTFTGRLSKAEWLVLSKNHDIFINTTNYDNLPVSVIEAMALGLPVVSTEVGGIPGLIVSNDNGLLVAKNDVHAFHKAIERLVNDKKLVEDMSTAARMKAETFDWQEVKRKWRDLFNQMKIA